MDVPLRRPAVLAALLALACNSEPGGGSGDASTSGTTGAAASTDGPALPTTGSESPSSPSSSATTGDTCSDGDARCLPPAIREVCDDGAWHADPCPEGQGCDPDVGATCQPCSCDPVTDTACVDANTLDVCDCAGTTTETCPANTACADLDGDVACHPVICTPSEASCAKSDTAQTCNETGTAWVPDPCPTTQLCDSFTGTCMAACTVVENLKSSLGCDFWAVDMPNLPPRHNFLYAVALSNTSTRAAAHVKVYDRNGGNEQLVASGTIDPRDVKVLNLSGNQDGEQGFYEYDAGFLVTGIAEGRAFHITSDVPIVATQFNPVGGAKAFSTDASLLLPTHTLGQTYYHMAWDQGSGAGSTLDVVATKDNTIITITAAVDVLAGTNGMPALKAGVPKQLPPLARNDYVQISLTGNDLTASKIEANAPIAVFGGHSCAHVPNNTIDGCDHLEEQIFPTATWGTHFVAGRAAPRGTEQMTWRVLGDEDTTLTFDPPVSGGANVELPAGEFVQFTADGDFEITATRPVLVAGYLHGCEDADLDDCPGDPSMVLVVPTEQWASDYVFLVDHSYTNNTVKLVRPTGEPVDIGCLAGDPEWTAVTPKYESAVVTFNGDNGCSPGTNTATSELPFAITVVGEANITSYAYPGGLQLKPINPG